MATSHIINGRTFWLENCCDCGVDFLMPDGLYRNCQNHRGPRGASFYCPNGHGQHYTGETEEEKLRRENQRLRQNEAYWEDRLVQEERRTAAYKGQVTKMKKRAAAGVCPCCKRTFQNLARHMHSQHPEYADEDNVVTLKTA